MRRVLGLTVVVALFTPAVASAEEAPYIPIPELLPPLAQGFQQSRGVECPDGASHCIDDTIARMTRRFHRVVPRCDHRAVFSVTYLRVTEDLRDAAREKFFDDVPWLQHEVGVFAGYYFRAYDNWASGHPELIPQVWRTVFQANKDGSVSALGDLLLNMNAHINRDMPMVISDIGIVRKDGRTTQKPDHDRQNRRLAKLYGPVIDEIARRFDPTTDDFNAGSADEELAILILQAWREGVWRNAERLHAARTAEERRQVAGSIEDYANAQAAMIKLLFPASPAQNAARDAHCARFGGQDPDLTRKGGIAALKLPQRSALRVARDKTVPVKVSCPIVVADCVGSVTLRSAGRKLGRRKFTIEPENTAKVRVPVGKPRRPVRLRVELRREGVPTARKLTRRTAPLR